MVHVKNALLSLVTLTIMIGCGNDREEKISHYIPPLETNILILDKSDQKEAHVVDGDTIDLSFDAQMMRIRLIGIDTFESRKNNKAYRQAYENNITVEEVVVRGKKATTYIKNRLSNRVTYYLEYDEEFKDRYGRALAYVWFSDSDMLNMDIICDGYAMPLTIKPNDKYAKEFKACYEEAKKRGIGVWQ